MPDLTSACNKAYGAINCIGFAASTTLKLYDDAPSDARTTNNASARVCRCTGVDMRGARVQGQPAAP